MVATKATYQHKRHGKHQKRTRPFLKVYWPYLPLAIIIVIGLVFSALWQPRMSRGVLAYATSMSVSDLLQDTNSDRVGNGLKALNLNSELDQAAQAKANDMATRNYWSHNTPEGNPPWTFIVAAGYSYQTAGENLAYGFATSSDTEAGWMGSPEHKANILNQTYTDVGFGFANSSNYNGAESTGSPETIVVAMYASPQQQASPSPVLGTGTTNQTPPSSSVSSQSKQSTTSSPTTNQPTPTAATSQPASSSQLSNSATKEDATKSVSRLAVATHNSLPWLPTVVGIILILAIGILALRHIVAIRKWLTRGERYVLHHAVFDVTVISLIGLCIVLSHASGFIK